MRSDFYLVVKNSSWQDTTEVAFVAANCLILLVTLHVGIVANLFVAWAVHHQKSLQTANNALLVNLAVIDILRCVIDCPLLLSVVLSARDARDLGLLFCSAQIASFSLICCVQLLTLACISAERYQAIANPFKSAERRKRITVLIPLTWLLPISISVVCVIFAKDSPVYVRCRGLPIETLEHYDTFGFYILTPVWCVCLTIITGFYGRIFMLVRAHGRKIFDKGSFPPPDKKKEDKQQKEMDTKINFKSENPQITDADNIKPSCGDFSPKPTAPGSDANQTEKSRETTNEESKFLESSEEPNDHQDMSEESFSSNNKSGMKSENQHQKINDVFEASTNEESGVETIHNDFAPNSPQSSVNEETGNEEGQNQDITSKTSTSNEEFGAVQRPTDGDISEGYINEDGREPNVHQDDLESQQSSAKEESAEEEPKSHQETNPSVKEKDVTFRSGTPQDTTEMLTMADVEASEEQPVPQEAAEESSPSSTEGATAAPQEEVVGAVCMMPSMAQRERVTAKKESKLAKRSGYIIFTFLVFWIPLIATVVLNHFYYRSGNLTVEVLRELEILTVSLVCVTSLTNPIIYAAVNPQFRTEFHNLKTKWKTFFTRS